MGDKYISNNKPISIDTPIFVKVDETAFDIGAEIDALRALNIGAIASFVGTVRDTSNTLESLVLEHYPQMTEKCLHKIAEDACQKFNIGGVRIHHRIGTMKPMEDIVLVVCSSVHRGDSIKAVNYIMDYLKTDAPFWKLEVAKGGTDNTWVGQCQSDIDTKDGW